MNPSKQLPPFLRVPLEIRLAIYRLLLVDEPAHADPTFNLNALPEYYEYEKHTDLEDTGRNRVLSFRSANPQHFKMNVHKESGKLRKIYMVRSGRFRAQCMDVTYNCVNVPDINPTILRVSKQIHEEAARLFYSSYTFDFDTSIEAVIPFLDDLTPYSRSFIRRMSLVKKALAYDRNFDRCEWQSMCHYVANNVQLNDLDLGVVAGKPEQGADLIVPIPATDYPGLIATHKKDELSWVHDLMEIKGLHRLDIRACVEHCQVPQSDALMFFVAFSASVGLGFTDYLMKQMIVPPRLI